MKMNLNFVFNNIYHPKFSKMDSFELETSNRCKEEVSNNTEEIEEKKEKKEKVYSTHTKFCTFGKDCKKKFKCVFAHNFKELCPIMCKYDSECLRKEKCYYMHTYETKVQYVKRAFPEELVKLKIKLVDNYNHKEENKKYIENTDDKEVLEEDLTEYIELVNKLRRMFYDPAFETMYWEDINEFVDLDCYEEEKGKKVLYVL